MLTDIIYCSKNNIPFKNSKKYGYIIISITVIGLFFCATHGFIELNFIEKLHIKK